MKKNNLLIDLVGITLGAALYSLAVTGINIPSKLADGGVTGIALLLNNLFGFAPSITSLLINLPLLLFSLFIFGKQAFFYGQLLVLLLWFSFCVHGKVFIYILRCRIFW